MHVTSAEMLLCRRASPQAGSRYAGEITVTAASLLRSLSYFPARCSGVLSKVQQLVAERYLQ
eukprot:5712570-Pleurochrysis_carterae.AAC.1